MSLRQIKVANTSHSIPISYSWHMWNDEKYHGKCFNYQISTIVQAALNMTLEIVLVCLPMPTLYKLQINWKQKLQLLVMFSLGLILAIICVLRLHALLQDYDPTNITWVGWTLGLWDAAEVFVSIICVCLPAAKVFFEQLFKKYLPVDREEVRRKDEAAWRHRHRHRRRRGPERHSDDSRLRIMKRTSLTISWAEDTAGADSVARLPEWATGWSRDDTQFSGTTTQITAGSFSRSAGDCEMGPWPAKKSRVWWGS